MRFPRSVGTAWSFATLVTLAACSGRQWFVGAPQSNQVAMSSVAGAGDASRIYVGECCGIIKGANGGVEVYKPLLAGRVERIVRGVKYPYSVEFDKLANLYLFNCLCDNFSPTPDFGSLAEYDRNSKRPSRRIGPFYWATAFALDASNRLYIANCNTCYKSVDLDRSDTGTRDTVNVYAAQSTKQLYTITKGVHQPVALTFDVTGNLYVANLAYNNMPASVTVYAPRSRSVLRTITRGLHFPSLLVTDKNGNLFVVDGGKAAQHPRILVYAAGSSKILHTIPGQGQGFLAIAIDASGALYAGFLGVSSTAGWVSVYSPDSFTEKYRISNGIYFPEALAFDAKGNLYVANVYNQKPAAGWISVYATGTKTPLRIAHTGTLGPPNSLAISP